MCTTPSSPQRTPELIIALRRSRAARIAGGSPAFPSHSRFTGGSPVRHSRVAVMFTPPQRTPEQLLALRRSFSRIAGGSPAAPAFLSSRFTGGSPVRRSRIAGGSPAVSRVAGGSPAVSVSRIAGGSPAVSVSRIAGGSPAIPSIVPDPDPPPFLTPTLNRSRPQPSTVLDPNPPPFPTPTLNRSSRGAILWTGKKFNFRWWESEFRRECLSSFVSWIYTLLDLNSFWIYMIWIHMPYQLWGRDVKFVLAYN
jgi:hypothetical protein